MSTEPPVAAALGPDARCSVHPARRAADACPACGRTRCGADAAAYGTRGCPSCVRERAGGVPAGRTEQWLRAGLAALAVAFVGGWIAAQYVDTQWFATVAPGLVGLGCAWAASSAAPAAPALLPAGVGAAAGVLATGLSDRLVPGGQNLFLPPGHRLPPYAAAIVGAVLWRVLFGPPRPSSRR